MLRDASAEVSNSLLLLGAFLVLEQQWSAEEACGCTGALLAEVFISVQVISLLDEEGGRISPVELRFPTPFTAASCALRFLQPVWPSLVHQGKATLHSRFAQTGRLCFGFLASLVMPLPSGYCTRRGLHGLETAVTKGWLDRSQAGASLNNRR